MTLIEAIPNLSEGRRSDVIRRLAASVSGDRDVGLLDCSSDPSHHRTVLTLVGTPDGLERAVVALAGVAVREIDLRQHQGVHPRIGAIDVVPFVPMDGATMADCVALAQRVGTRLAAELRLPVFLYEQAAASPARRNLERIRRGGFEQLTSRLADPLWHPDFGPLQPHPTAGATVVGARAPLIAWNLNLATDQVTIAREIARAIRESSGGLPGVKAMGVMLAHRGLAQVSMNLTDYRRTPMHVVFRRVVAEAARHQVEVRESELIGLVPRQALADARREVPDLWTWHAGQILEDRMARWRVL